MYSFLLSYRNVVGDQAPISSFKRVGMRSGSEFIPFFTNHSRVNSNSTMVKYPAFSAYLIFEYMSNSGIFTAIQSMVLEKSIVFVADNASLLTDIMHGFQELMEPL